MSFYIIRYNLRKNLTEMIYSIKTIPVIVLSGVFATILELVRKVTEKYIFADWEFLTFLFILIVIDTSLGLWKAYNKGEICSKGFSLLFRKLIAYCMVLILTHIVTHYTVEGYQNEVMNWFDNFVFASLIIRESISILENIAIIYPNIIPNSILKKLNRLDGGFRFKSNNHEKSQNS